LLIFILGQLIQVKGKTLTELYRSS